MNILVLYDSVFGNTEKVAKTMGEVLGSMHDINVVRITDMTLEQLQGVELMIVGSPTRAFKPTKEVVDFLIKIPASGLEGMKVAAFDTRINTTDVNSKLLNGLVRIFGYAAKPIADKLVKKGGSLVAAPEGFFVKDNEGPLKEEELERASEWAKTLLQ